MSERSDLNAPAAGDGSGGQPPAPAVDLTAVAQAVMQQSGAITELQAGMTAVLQRMEQSTAQAQAAQAAAANAAQAAGVVGAQTAEVASRVSGMAPAKAKEPPTFHGRPNEFADNWLFMVEGYINATGLEPERQVAWAGQYLRDSPSMWWQRRCQRAAAGEEPPLLTFQEFGNALKAAFDSPDMEDVLREELQNCKQTRSVREFVALLQAKELLLTSFPDRELLAIFKRGLKRELRMFVAAQNPPTFAEAAKLADNLDAVLTRMNAESRQSVTPAQSRPSAAGRLASRPQHRPAVSSSQQRPAPMELGAMRNQQGRNTAPARGARGTGSLRCWLCNAVGHVKADCPRRQGNGRRQKQRGALLLVGR